MAIVMRSTTIRKSSTTGLVLSLVVGAGCLALASVLPWASALLVAILLGMAVSNLKILPATITSSASRWSRPVLRLGIVILGLQLSLASLGELGWQGVVVVLVTVVFTFVVTLLLGRLFQVPPVSRMLVATGFAICGASAIAAMSSVVDPEQESEADTAQSIALVTIFGTICLFLLPMLRPMLPLSDEQMGLWIGSSVHEVAQVVASAGAVSAAALAIATIAKLGRVVLLAPLIAVVGAARRGDAVQDPTRKRPPVMPLFVLGFIAAMLVRSFVPLPREAIDIASFLSTWLLAAAMFGLGVAVDLVALVRTGGRAVALGAAATAVAVGTSFAAILITGAGA